MSKIEWSQVKMSDIQQNILTGGKEGVSAADALDARSAAYQAGKSHGAARFLKGLFSLGINEIWRFANYQSYESDKAKIVNCVKDVYKALEPKLGEKNVRIVFREADHNLGSGNFGSEVVSTPHVDHSTGKVKLLEAKATIERKADGSGLVTIAGMDEGIVINDCEQARRNLEISMMREAKRFGKDFVMGILNGYKESALGDVGTTKAGTLHFGDGDDKQSIGQRRFMAGMGLINARTDEAHEVVEARLQDQTGKSSARAHLKAMLSAFYSSQLDLPEEVGRTMDLALGVELAGKVMDGEIDDGKKLQAFLDKGSKGCHLTTAEGQKVMAQFEKAEAAKDAAVGKITIDAKALAPKDPRPTLPQGEIKKLHDFVADLIMNEENTEYDKSLDAGRLTGRRLRTLVRNNSKLVADLMGKEAAALDETLKTLEPRMAKVLKETILAPLEQKYQDYVDKQKADKKNYVLPRADWLGKSINDAQKSAAKTRIALGVRHEDEISNDTLDSLTTDNSVRSDLEAGGANLKDVDFMSDEKGRQQIALGLDFFAEKEKELEKAVGDALKEVQQKMSGRLDAIFGPDEKAEVDKSAQELGNMTLEEIQKAYAKDPTITLVKNTLKTYFKDIGPLQQRQMLAAQTRFCAEIEGETTDGARFGALMKGAGPVMQKMLQGIDASKFGDDEFKLALADMKDNLAPISDKAVKAYLYDLMKNSDDPKIVSIDVKKSLGQASVGQALLCTVKREGLEPQECVVKILRPNAALAAHREHDLFIAACGDDASMKATFEGRFASIEEELDLTIEAENMKRAQKTYAYDKDIPEIGTFKNTTSAKLFEGVKPTSSVMMQEKVEGVTVKQFLEETHGKLTDANANVSVDDLKAMKEKLLKTHAALVSTSYMWANEGLFGSGFYHGDLHAGNLMVGKDGKVTMIDFGNATQLDKTGRTNVTRVITGAAVGNAELFLEGYVALLGADGKSNYEANKDAIKAKLDKVFEKQGLADTALRLSIALNILQLDFKIEVPGAVHNFLESQKRLSAAMDDTARLIKEIDARLGTENPPKPLSMMQCLVQVVRNNISLRLLMTIGLKNANDVMDTVQNDPLLKPPQDGNVVIVP